MGGQVDWAALPFLCERYGIADPDRLVDNLDSIRKHKTQMANTDGG